jgi:hypothetical protein
LTDDGESGGGRLFLLELIAEDENGGQRISTLSCGSLVGGGETEGEF